MDVFYPEYYREFLCIASACPDSCCKEWTVDVDEASARFYKSLSGDLGDRLRQVLRDTEDGTVMEIEDGRCPMWRRDGLCRIQAELGHDALCKTCRDFPRLRHDYGDFVELGLELSCPEAARLIMNGVRQNLIREQMDGGDLPDYEPETMAILRESRQSVLEFLSAGQYSLPESLAILLLYGHGVQAQLDGAEGEMLDGEICLKKAKKYAAQGDGAALVEFYKNLEILSDQWLQRLSEKMKAPVWDDRLWAVARYFVQRYWLQAVSDYDLVSRVKLTVASCLLIAMLGGDPVQTAQQYSKEIENDPDNIDAILDGAYTALAMTDRNLLSLLLT